ncbi:MAG TPA: hypothetical protein VFN99_08735 [Gaiella sp.]|nr:hypothetical protein [Gaiella sp.]
MRYEGEVRVPWSRSEVTAVREAMEVTPLFAGRTEVRDLLRRRLRSRRVTEVAFDLVIAEHLASNLVALDMRTAIAKSKLLRALQDNERNDAAAAA